MAAWGWASPLQLSAAVRGGGGNSLLFARPPAAHQGSAPPTHAESAGGGGRESDGGGCRLRPGLAPAEIRAAPGKNGFCESRSRMAIPAACGQHPMWTVCSGCGESGKELQAGSHRSRTHAPGGSTGPTGVYLGSCPPPMMATHGLSCTLLQKVTPAK